MLFVALGIVVVLVVMLVAAVKVVKPGTVAVVERSGRFQRLAPPGVLVMLPFVDRIRAHVTNQPQVLIMPSRPLATSDGGWVIAPTTVHFAVVDPVRATYEIASPALALEQLVMTGLRQVVRAFTTPARRARAHSPRDTTFAPKPRSVTARMTAGTSLALTENWRTIGSGKASRTSAQAASSVARSMT